MSVPEIIVYDDPYSIPTSITDFLGRTTTFGLDSHGNVLRRTDPDGLHEDWTYNSAGQVLTDTDRAGSTTTYTYDSYGRATRVTYPIGSTAGGTGEHVWVPLVVLDQCLPPLGYRGVSGVEIPGQPVNRRRGVSS